MNAPLVGIFIGGASSRMGRPKGMLKAPSGEPTLVERLAACATLALPLSKIVLVGTHDAYASLPFPQLPDPKRGAGPLAGLVALLSEGRRCGAESVLALSCDLPFLTSEFLARLATEKPEAVALAPRSGDAFEPLCARYGVACLEQAELALAQGSLSLQRLLRTVHARELDTKEGEDAQLRDWDTPEDLLNKR